MTGATLAPDREALAGGGESPWPIEPLLAAPVPDPSAETRGGVLPHALAARFAGRFDIPLRPDRPTLLVNFVTTLDGAVALDRSGATGGREISGGFEPDRFLMGLLRATADAVIVGAGTVRASHSKGWTPGDVHPASAEAFAAWRRELGLAEAGPATVIISASGDLEPRDLPRTRVPVLVATTDAGAERLEPVLRGADVQPEILAFGHGSHVPPDDLLARLAERGVRVALSEGGPTVFGTLLDAGVVDELFLTLAPQLVGRDTGADRLALVEHAAFDPTRAPWLRLRSLMRSADHLFLRYGLPEERKDAS